MACVGHRPQSPREGCCHRLRTSAPPPRCLDFGRALACRLSPRGWPPSHRLLQRLADHEAYDPPCWNGDRGSGLGIARDARPFRMYLPGAKAPQEHGLALLERFLHRGHDRLDGCCRLHVGAAEGLGHSSDNRCFPHPATLLVTYSNNVTLLTMSIDVLF